MKNLIGVVLAAAVVISTPPALAQADDFRALVDQGMQAYRNRRYADAITAFESAFAIRREPELVYNIARAHEKSLNSQKALQTYERFLSLQGTTAELRAKALSAVEAIRAEQSARARAAARQAAPPPASPPRGESRAAAGNDGALELRAGPPSPSRALEWTLIGGGVAIAAAGGVFAVLAAMDNSTFEDSDTDPTRLPELKDSIDRNALIADILVPVGLVTAGIGTILYLTTGNEEGVALAPMAAPDGAGLAVSGNF